MIKKILAILTFTYSFLNAQEEMKYDKNAENLPEWIRLMNVDIPDVGLVKDAYDKYYRINNFEKNKYTQYYKRWLRNISRYSNAKPNNKKQKALINGSVLVLGTLIKMQKVEVMLLDLHIFIQ